MEAVSLHQLTILEALKEGVLNVKEIEAIEIHENFRNPNTCEMMGELVSLGYVKRTVKKSRKAWELA